MNIIEIIAQDVFDKVRGRFSNLEMGDETGAVTVNPRDARFFDFDFAIEGNNLGRVSVSLSELGSLKIFYGQGITESVDAITLDIWYDFLREMRYFAKRRMLRFDTRDIMKGNLNKNDFAYLAQNGTKENNMSESKEWSGTKRTSFRKLENTLLRVKHSDIVDENQPGARTRKYNIESLFIENEAGERFKYPFIHVAGAKAMQRHVANGGRPYDEFGQSIINMSEQISQLSAFKRQVGAYQGMNEAVDQIVERSQEKLANLRKMIEGLSKQSHYQQWVESFTADDNAFELDQATLEDYKSKFTVKNFKEDLAQFFPLIHKIMQEAGTVDLEQYAEIEDNVSEDLSEPVNDFEDFEAWAESVTEGRIEPDTLMDLKELLDQGLIFGADGMEAINALQGIGIHDEGLELILRGKSENNANGDASSAILEWLAQEDPEAAAEFAPQQQAAPAPEELPVADEEEETMTNAEPDPERPNAREIAEVVKSFYDRETGKFPKGETGVVTHCKKMFGDQGGALAERLVAHLSQQGQQREQQMMAQQQFEDIKKLAGLAK
jgi:uncharacterized protein YukE